MSQEVRFKVGSTRSGKPIFCFAQPNMVSINDVLKCLGKYLLDDLLDAYCVFEYLMKHSLRISGEFSNELLIYFNNQSIIKQRFVDEELFNKVKERNNIKTSMDACKHGSRLVNVEFKDL